jgi:tetratricopeptide (TPR) repeat protein
MSAARLAREGLDHARAGRLFAAEAALRAALAARPTADLAANLAANLAGVLQQQGRPAEACAALYPHLKAGAPHPVGWNTLGVALLDLGDLEAAAGCFARAHAQDPTAVLPLVHLHAALFDDQAPGPAREALERAAALDRLHPPSRFHLGVLWGLLAPAAAERHHALLPPEAAAWRDAWAFALAHRDPGTRFFASTAATLRHAAALAPPEGFVVELGVRFGTTARLLQAATGAEVHGFDTFEGLPEAWHTVPAGAYSTGGQVPELGPQVHLHRGRFAHTVPPFAAAQPGPARLIHVDCDLYASTLEGLEPLVPHLRPGTVLLFDEYLMNPNWREDEHAALVELGARHGLRWRYAAFSFFSHQAAVVITGVGGRG